MKMKCLYKTELRGDIVKVGQVVDISDDEAKLDVVRKFFVAAGSDEAAAAGKPAVAAASAAAAKGLIAGLTRDQAVMKLQQAGVKVKGNISSDKLAELFASTFDATPASVK